MAQIHFVADPIATFRLRLLWLTAACLAIGLGLAGCALPAGLPFAPAVSSSTPNPISAGTSTPVPPTSTLISFKTGMPGSTSAAGPSPTRTRTQPPGATSLPGSPTLSPTITRTPTITQTPTRTRWVYATFTPIPTKTPTITPTPTPQLAYLRILRPGTYSRLLSPIQVEASVSPGDDGLVQVQLQGEDGRVLAGQRLDYHEYLTQSIAIAPKLIFNLNGVSELGRLVISVNDRFGRLSALTSTDLILLSLGANDFSPPESGIAPYLLRSPVADQIIQGGIIAIRGLARPVNEKPVILELLDEQGQVLANAQVLIQLPSGELSHTPFSIDLAYKISAPIKARLVIRQESANRIPGTIALWSVQVNLQP